MIAEKKTWDYQGQTISSRKVRIFQALAYIQGRLLDPFADLLTLMSNHPDDTSIMARTGAVGLPLAETAKHRNDQVFTLLREKGYMLLVVVVTGYVPGVPSGTPIAVEIVDKEENY